MRHLALKLLLLCVLFVASAGAQAQIAFRAAASSVANGNTPTFRAAASAASTTGTLTITKPSGVITNDVLVASIAVTPSSAAINAPSGWTLVRRTDNAGPTSNSLAVYYKAVGTSEPASYSWGVSGASFAVGGIQAFFLVDPANPIDVENGQATPSSTSHTAPGVTTTVANTMLVSSHAYASSRTWTAPSGMTESFDRPSGNNNATGLSIEGNRVLQAVAGASGAKTATAAAEADAGNAHLLALRPAPATLSISHPAGTVSWDLMIAAIAFSNSTASIVPDIVPPSGWTLVRRIDNHAANSNSLVIYRRFADIGNPNFYTWRIAGGAYLVGGIQSFSGVDTFDPIEVENGQSTPSSTTHATPSITTTRANSMLVTAHTYASSQNWTPEAGLTEGFDQRAGGAMAAGQSITGTYQLQALAGPSGAKQSTAAASADVGNTHILALRPPNVAPTVTLTSPTNGASFNAPANITITATAADSDGTIQKVEFFYGGNNLIATVTTPPYSIVWTGVPQGAYVLTAVATDDRNGGTRSAPVSVTVEAAVAQLYFIEVDHLNTPRLVANATGTTMWRWEQQEPFGVNVPDENPSGLGAFEFSLRFAGQYADKETNLHYNYFRDYDPGIGRYVQSDPIGLAGGINTYSYVSSNVLLNRDPLGLSSHGCGSGPRHGRTPNLWFRECCDAHDACYDDCKKQPPKSECDSQFCGCVFSKCTGWANSAACRALAAGYCAAVTASEDAQKAFDNARKKCKETPVACIPGGQS